MGRSASYFTVTFVMDVGTLGLPSVEPSAVPLSVIVEISLSSPLVT